MKLRTNRFTGNKSISTNLSPGSSARTSPMTFTELTTDFEDHSSTITDRRGPWASRSGNSLQPNDNGVPSPNSARDYQELAAAFGVIDQNGDGKISAAELGCVLRSLRDNPSDEELQLMVEAVDDDGDGYIDLKEFVNLNRRALGSNGPTQRSEELRAAFCVFDIDNNNYISAEELHQVLTELGEKSLTLAECCRMIRGVDSDGDGLVNFEEFERMMTSDSAY